MKPVCTQPFTAFVGIDWADTKHDICLQAAGNDQREFDCIAHQVARIDDWAKSLQQRFGGPIAIALELAKGPIVYALQKYDFFVLFPPGRAVRLSEWLGKLQYRKKVREKPRSTVMAVIRPWR